MRAKTTLVVLLAALAVGAGCGQSEQEKAMADVCAARDDITKQIDELKGLTLSTATTDKVKTSLQAIRDDLTKIGDASAKLSQSRKEEVRAANDTFTSSVRDTLQKVGTSVSLQDASAQLKAAFEALGSSYQSTFGKLDCS